MRKLFFFYCLKMNKKSFENLKKKKKKKNFRKHAGERHLHFQVIIEDIFEIFNFISDNQVLTSRILFSHINRYTHIFCSGIS